MTGGNDGGGRRAAVAHAVGSRRVSVGLVGYSFGRHVVRCFTRRTADALACRCPPAVGLALNELSSVPVRPSLSPRSATFGPAAQRVSAFLEHASPGAGHGSLGGRREAR